MRRCFIYGLVIIVTFLSLFLHDKVVYGIRFAIVEPAPPDIVTEVLDGDTIKIKTPNGVKGQVRLIGINTPELDYKGLSDRATVDVTRFGVNKDSLVTMGQLAKQYVENKIPEGTQVRVVGYGLDPFGRTVGEVLLKDEKGNYNISLNEMLLKNGYAETMFRDWKTNEITGEFTKFSNITDYMKDKFTETESEAKEEKMGFWEQWQGMSEKEAKDEVKKWYRDELGRVADKEGLEFWLGKLRGSGGDVHGIKNAFVNTPEFKAELAKRQLRIEAEKRAATIEKLRREAAEAEAESEKIASLKGQFIETLKGIPKAFDDLEHGRLEDTLPQTIYDVSMSLLQTVAAVTPGGFSLRISDLEEMQKSLDATRSIAHLDPGHPDLNVSQTTLASANPITTLINFDNLMPGAVIGSSYQNLGAQFTNFQILTQGVSLNPLATAPSFANVAWIPSGTNASINFSPAVASAKFIYGNIPTLTISALQGNTILKTLRDTVNDFPRIDNIANFEGVGCIKSLKFVQEGSGDTVLDNLQFTRTLHCSEQ